jgi:hypothetical protein
MKTNGSKYVQFNMSQRANTGSHPELMVTDLLGSALSDIAIEQLFAELQTLSRPSITGDEKTESQPHYDWVLVRRKGIELGFVDKMYFEAQAEHAWGNDENLMLNQVTFYASGARDGVVGWADALPFDLTLSDTRTTARKKLSMSDSSLRTGTRDCWDFNDRRVVLTYFPDDRGVESVHVKLCISPWDEASRQQPKLDIQQWIELFGMRSDDTRFIDAVTPLDVNERIEDDEDDREVAFLCECGIDLYFENRKQLKLPASRHVVSNGLVFAAVKFFRARDREARQWVGELPSGLNFDDTIELAINKVGAQPALRDEGATTGFALWHLAECSLHILYSGIENHLLRVTMMAPGYWQDTPT